MTDEYPMNWTDALKAMMIDGEIVRDYNRKTPSRYNSDKQQFEFFTGTTWKHWNISGPVDRAYTRWQIVKDFDPYTATFGKAVEKMVVHGCKAQNSFFTDKPYRYNPDTHMFETKIDGEWVVALLSTPEQLSRWKILD